MSLRVEAVALLSLLLFSAVPAALVVVLPIPQAQATSPFVSDVFIAGPATTPKISSTTTWYDYRFTAQQSGTVTKVSTYVSSVAGTPGLTLALYADNGLSSHLPTGLVLGSATAKPVANSYAWESPGIGNQLTLSPSVAITAGTVYHLVVSSNNASNSNYFYIRYYPQNRIWINGTSNPDRAVLTSTNSGSTWSTISPPMEPIYSLLFSNNQVEGNGYAGGATDEDHIFGTASQGFTFYVASAMSPVTFNKISLVVAKTGTPADNLYGHIASITTLGPYHNGEALATGRIWSDFTFATSGTSLPTCCDYGGTLNTIPPWTNATFSPVSLTTGEYVFYLSSPQSDNAAYYDILQLDGRGSDMSSGGAYLDGRLTYGADQNSTFLASSHTRTTLDTEFGVDIPFVLSTIPNVMQPIKVTMSNSAPSAALTFTGSCGPSQLSFPSDGSVYKVAMVQTCPFTVQFTNAGNTRDGFIVSSAFSAVSPTETSCAFGTCPEIDLMAYEDVREDFAYSLTGGGNPTTPTLTGTYLGAAGTSIATLTTTLTGYWLDFNTEWTVTNLLNGSGASERWDTARTNGTSSAGASVTLAYYHQFRNTYACYPNSPTEWDGAYACKATVTYLGQSPFQLGPVDTAIGGGAVFLGGWSDSGSTASLPTSLGSWTAFGTYSWMITAGGNTYTVNYAASITTATSSSTSRTATTTPTTSTTTSSSTSTTATTTLTTATTASSSTSSTGSSNGGRSGYELVLAIAVALAFGVLVLAILLARGNMPVRGRSRSL